MSPGGPAGDERARILAALAQASYRRDRAAALHGVDRSTLWRRMRRYGIEG